MDATLFLADAAQVSPDGKLHALGVGWYFTNSPSAPSAVAFILHVPWDETNQRIKWTLDLLTADGKPVLLPGASPTSFMPIHMESEIEVGRPPGLKKGASINVPFAVTVGPLPLPPDATFEWVLKVEERHWRVAFATRPIQQPPSA